MNKNNITIVKEIITRLHPVLALFYVELERRGDIKVFSELVYRFGAIIRIYYILQWLDQPVSDGVVRCPVYLPAFLAGITTPTLWKYLKACKKVGLVRYYKSINGNLIVYLGSQYKAARNKKFKDLGSIALTNKIFTLRQLKEVAVAGATYDLQNQSRYAAIRSFRSNQRKQAISYSFDKLLEEEKVVSLENKPLRNITNLTPKANSVFRGNSSGNKGTSKGTKNKIKQLHDTSNLELKAKSKILIKRNSDKPLTLHKVKSDSEHKFLTENGLTNSHFLFNRITNKKLYVPKATLIYGTNQKSIAWEIGCSVDTIQRHQKHLTKRQVCQTLDSYRNLAGIIQDLGDIDNDYELENVSVFALPKPPGELFTPFQLDISVHGMRHNYRTVANRNRLFQSKYDGQWYLAMTNLYFLSTEQSLAGVRASRLAYKDFCDNNLNQMPTICAKTSHKVQQQRMKENWLWNKSCRSRKSNHVIDSINHKKNLSTKNPRLGI